MEEILGFDVSASPRLFLSQVAVCKHDHPEVKIPQVLGSALSLSHPPIYHISGSQSSKPEGFPECSSTFEDVRSTPATLAYREV